MGLDGNTPARLFTAIERGMYKHVYSLRLTFWRLVSKLIDRGGDAYGAIDRISNAYGSSKCVTDVIKGIKNDKRQCVFKR